jgi:exodeoxyribonuclease V
LVLGHIENFLTNDHDFLIVKGAAGTGKTSIMKAVVTFLQKQESAFQLLAPTGRAAKNLSQKSGFSANTIHSGIYSVDTDIEKAMVVYTLKTNLTDKQQVFIVDESSMIGDKALKQEGYSTPRSIMADFIRYVSSTNYPYKIIFVGDICQLAPMGYESNEISPALSKSYLKEKYQLTGSSVELTKVMRQADGSSILDTAHAVRACMLTDSRKRFSNSIGSRMGNPYQVALKYLNHYDSKKSDAAAIISYGNKYAEDANKLVRAELGLQGILAVGDKVVLNQNYYGKSFEYVSNGEMGEVASLGSKTKVEDLTFIDAEVEFKDAFGQKFKVKSKILLDVLENRQVLNIEKKKALFALAFKNNPAFRNSKKIWDDEFLSAMQIGYGHAFTCHKAQGSEWDTVLLNSWSPNNDLRFLYTGITRARKNLYTNSGHLF